MPKIAIREKTREKTSREKEPLKTAKKASKEPAVAAVAVAEMDVLEGPTCAHHWVIASPDGEMSVGRCKVCGAEKEFPNSAEDYLWERSVPQSRWTGRADTKSFSDGF